jgi:PKD repeat protein
MKKRSSWVMLWLAASCLLWWLVFSQDGLKQVDTLIDAEEVLDRGVVTRYDLAQYLNLVDCVDCLDPDPHVLELYTQERRDLQKTLTERYIEDIVPGKEMYWWQEYSMCLARVLDNERMSWYPKSTSPFCPGRFCWSNTLAFGEFVQTLVAFQWEGAYSFAELNRESFLAWVREADVVLDSASSSLVAQKIQDCGNLACDITSQEEFSLYLRYCRHNLTECGMQSTQALSQGDVGIAYTNILLDTWILRSEDIQDLWRFAPVPSQLFLEVFDTLIQESPCLWAEDTDLDGVKDEFDICKRTYNPYQDDQDNDGIGDVCDYDIDGDGVLNSPGVVDDAWNIRYDRLADSDDVCVLIRNPEQDDRDRDGIWDLCDTDEKSLAGSDAQELLPAERLTTGSLSIQASVTQGFRPLLVEFEVISDRGIASVDWNFGDGDWSTALMPEHIFDMPWVWIVRAVATFDDGSKAAAKQAIHIQTDEESFVWFEASADILQWEWPLESTLKHRYEWELDTVVWTIWEHQEAVQAGQDYVHRFEGEWLYEVLAQWYRLDTLVAVSRLMIDVMGPEQTWRWAYLETDSLLVTPWQEVTLRSQIDWFDEELISQVLREIWDELIESEYLVRTQSFSESWPVVVRQRIDFLDWYPSLVQELTLYVVPETQEQTSLFGVRMVVEKELLQVSEELWVRVEITWWDISEIQSIQRKAAGLQRENTSLEETFIFATSGAKRIGAHVITASWQLFVLEATVNVLGNELCVTNTWFCDYDKDTIIDMCDEDIDGDGVENVLGLLIWENNACRFTASILDFDRLDEQRDRILAWEVFDSCPFVPNPDQWDADGDAIGDPCDASDEPNLEEDDTDGDWIPDTEDACPEVPENKNGTEDEDWCPEITPWSGWWGGGWGWWSSSAGSSSAGWGWWWGTNDPWVQPDECIQCPCPKADFISELMPWDRVKAVLVDPSEEIIYSHSAPRVIRAIE